MPALRAVVVPLPPHETYLPPALTKFWTSVAPAPAAIVCAGLMNAVKFWSAGSSANC